MLFNLSAIKDGRRPWNPVLAMTSMSVFSGLGLQDHFKKDISKKRRPNRPQIYMSICMAPWCTNIYWALNSNPRLEARAERASGIRGKDLVNSRSKSLQRAPGANGKRKNSLNFSIQTTDPVKPSVIPAYTSHGSRRRGTHERNGAVLKLPDRPRQTPSFRCVPRYWYFYTWKTNCSYILCRRAWTCTTCRQHNGSSVDNEIVTSSRKLSSAVLVFRW